MHMFLAEYWISAILLPRLTLLEQSQSEEGDVAQNPRTPPDYDGEEMIMMMILVVMKMVMKLMKKEGEWVKVKVRTQVQ